MSQMIHFCGQARVFIRTWVYMIDCVTACMHGTTLTGTILILVRGLDSYVQ